ncbi:molt-inhibiting hormone-like [Eriocheir sinensis]|uniref:Molt-inhibiting hormone n=1 Tax=Eriocheir sinensis TaxID=95602 RepID=Q5VKS2_ERISI|nr:molt-inhibiting hormone-like [Eriocheir sinensis]AAQ81640.1 molt-inhibiting hormone 1 [Eriocheir sinensis]ABC68517.1 molt-inhibiting hormone [Eriocheir sinensis]
MVSRAQSRFSSQRTWLVAAVVLAVLCSFGVQRAAAGIINAECPNMIGNRDIYKKVDWICEDCANIFRIDGLGMLCRKNCFRNIDFLWCVYASERHAQKDDLTRYVSILGQ